MPYFEGTDKYGLLEQIQFNGRVPLNSETVGLRWTDPEILIIDPTLEKVSKRLKAAKGLKDVIQGGAKIRAGLLLMAPDPFLGPVDEVVGWGLLARGGIQATKGIKSLAEVSMS